MVYTKQQLADMSDKQITTALATILFDAQGAPYTINQTVRLSKFDNLRQDCLGEELYPHAIDVICGFGMRLDYCNNPSDIMPLAFENKLRITPHVKSMWLCLSNHKDARKRKEYFDKSPLRAIACCLILALQEL